MEFELGQATALLERTPPTLHAWLTQLPPAWVRATEPFDRFAQRSESAGKTLGGLLGEFADLRTANLATLRGWTLTAADLDRTGRHPEFGRVTLRQHLATWVAHDLGHLAQIARVMASQYGDQVGPWRRYLRILSQ